MMDLDAFEERAAIAEYEGGLSRFQAETLAAKEQGLPRHEVMKHAKNNKRDIARGGDNRQTSQRIATDNLPRVLGRAQEKN